MHNARILFAIVGISLGFASGISGETQAPSSSGRPILLVVNQGDRNLSLVDPAEGRQIATISEELTEVHGHEVAASPDGRLAYVPIYGSSGVGKPGIDGQEMLVMDIASRKIVNKVDFGSGVRPHCVVYDAVSGMLYVTTEMTNTVTIVDPQSLKIAGTIPTTQPQSHMVVISHDGRRGYTSNVSPGSVSVLDIAKRKTVAVVPISANAQRIAISNDDSMVFTADQTEPRLAVIDTSTNKIKAWVALPSVGYGTAATKDSRWLLVTTEKSSVAVVDLATLQVARTIPVPGEPQEILVSPDGKTAYVSCKTNGPGDKVAVIDLSQWKVQALVEAGRYPDGLAWAGGIGAAGNSSK